jgi:hypothetical protein
MSDKFSPKDSKNAELDDVFGENPGYPSRKRPADIGIPIEPQPPPAPVTPPEGSED